MIAVVNVLLAVDEELVNVADNNGNSALHLAAFYGREEICLKLIENGAQLYLNNEDGDIPFNLAQDIKLKQILMVKRSGDYIVSFLPNDTQFLSEQFNAEKDARKKLEYFWAIIISMVTHFWKEYRAFLYIGLLIATGSWTLIDYIPTILGTAPPPPTVNYPKGVERLITLCNPPSMLCGKSSVPVFPIPPDIVVPRSLQVPAVTSIESYLLNFGQFSIFIGALFLIVYHFKEKLDNVKFWSIVFAIFGVLLVGSLFIFDVL